jgi:pre-mRNA-splicing helicase BRR2
VYVAPLDAIVAERAAEWTPKFGPGGLGLAVEVLTGESAPDLKRLERGQLVLSSAANWDMISRRWKQRKNVQVWGGCWGGLGFLSGGVVVGVVVLRGSAVAGRTL